MSTTPKFVKAATWDEDLPVFDVLVDGKNVGQVFKGWWRTGGEGWGNSARGSLVRVAGSRKAATTDLLNVR